MAEDNYYDDAPLPAEAEATMAEAPVEEEVQDSNLTLLPKSFFPPEKDLAPGSVCKIQVEEVREDQVLVSYAKDEGQEEEVLEEAPMPAGPPMDAEMSGMY